LISHRGVKEIDKNMFSQVTSFLCGPFFYPLYFASFLHTFDFFVNFAALKSTQSEPRSPFLHPSAIDSVLQSTGHQKEKK
jgi:hypothetical protein